MDINLFQLKSKPGTIGDDVIDTQIRYDNRIIRNTAFGTGHQLIMMMGLVTVHAVAFPLPILITAD
jgi:hypothetical protein